MVLLRPIKEALFFKIHSSDHSLTHVQNTLWVAVDPIPIRDACEATVTTSFFKVVKMIPDKLT